MLKRRMVFNRTASKFLEVLSLILTMIVEIVVKPASAMAISANPLSIFAVSKSAPGFDQKRLSLRSD